MRPCDNLNQIENMVAFDQINNIQDNEFIKKLHQDSMNKEQFLDCMIPFIHAVDNWSKVLALLIAKLPKAWQRIVILKNLNDENGNGDLDNAHVNTFDRFLNQIGYTGQDSIDIAPNKSVKTFNDKLLNSLQNQPWEYNVAMLGMIEYTYINISSAIHEYTVRNYGLDPRKIDHFSLHETLDIEHANDLFSLIDVDSEIDGLQYGYQLINDVFNDLLSHATMTSE